MYSFFVLGQFVIYIKKIGSFQIINYTNSNCTQFSLIKKGSNEKKLIETNSLAVIIPSSTLAQDNSKMIITKFLIITTFDTHAQLFRQWCFRKQNNDKMSDCTTKHYSCVPTPYLFRISPAPNPNWRSILRWLQTRSWRSSRPRGGDDEALPGDQVHWNEEDRTAMETVGWTHFDDQNTSDLWFRLSSNCGRAERSWPH